MRMCLVDKCDSFCYYNLISKFTKNVETYYNAPTKWATGVNKADMRKLIAYKECGIEHFVQKSYFMVIDDKE